MENAFPVLGIWIVHTKTVLAETTFRDKLRGDQRFPLRRPFFFPQKRNENKVPDISSDRLSPPRAKKQEQTLFKDLWRQDIEI